MEAIRLADLIPLTLVAFALAALCGLYGARSASLPLAAGLAVRSIIVLLRAAGYSTFARDRDAYYFASGSMRIITSGVGTYSGGGAGRYEHYLAFLRRNVGMSVLGLELTSLLAWAVAAFLLRDTLRRLKVERPASVAIWLFAVAPSGLLWTSGLLRETYQVATVSFAGWLFVVVRATRPTTLLGRAPILAASGGLLAGAAFHTAFALSAIGLLAGSEVLRLVGSGNKRPIERWMIVAALVFGLAFFGNAIAGPTSTLKEERAQRSEFGGGGAEYRAGLPNLGALTVPADVVVGYVLYVVSPLPYQIRGPADLIAFAEAAVRVAIMALALRDYRRRPGVATFLLMVVMVQLSFSVGTLNWGTALRHNYVSVPALVVLAALTAKASRPSGDGDQTSSIESTYATPRSLST